VVARELLDAVVWDCVVEEGELLVARYTPTPAAATIMTMTTTIIVVPIPGLSVKRTT